MCEAGRAVREAERVKGGRREMTVEDDREDDAETEGVASSADEDSLISPSFYLSLSLSQTPNPSLPRNLRPQHPDPKRRQQPSPLQVRGELHRPIRPFKNNSSAELIDPLQFEPEEQNLEENSNSNDPN
ncbi:hypothetical protein Syun_028292 [Stephania yunnanensis]|uniref:Uncharacterized protein n=1 Tax=Stephania yunnanensis TaxID=152371 RepID=A0AAP0EH28_9MAGN